MAHTSVRPVVLGRYSYLYAFFLVEYITLICFAAILVFAPMRARQVRTVFRALSAKGMVLLGMLALAMLFVAFLVVGQRLLAATPIFLGLVGAIIGMVVFDHRRSVALFSGLDRIPWGNVVLAGLSLLLTLEVFLRAFRPVLWSGGPFVQDPMIGFRATSDPEVNSLGLRDREFVKAKTAGSYRIIGLGDSMAYGFEVPIPENYHKLLEGRLEGNGKRRVEVLNFGVSSSGPRDQLRLLERTALGYDPDLVMVSFYVGNDFFDNVPGGERLVINGLPVTIRRPEILGGFPYHGTYLSVYLETIVRPMRDELRKWRESRSTGQRVEGPTSEERYLSAKATEMASWKRLADPASAEHVAFVKGVLRGIRDLSKSRDAQFVLIILPSQIQVEDDLRSQVLARYRQTVDPDTLQLPQRLLREFAIEHEIRFVDPLPEFRAHGPGLYAPRDLHLSKAGHYLVAEIVYRYLSEHRLVPALDVSAIATTSVPKAGGQ